MCMLSRPSNFSQVAETDADRLRGTLAQDALSLDLVSALAGDRKLLDSEILLLDRYRSRRGAHYFSDILYSVSHQYYLPNVAEELWKEILQHKHVLTKTLGRNVRIVVAMLDYITNITNDMDSAMLIGEDHLKEIVGLSFHDNLTGLYNHAYFYQQIDLEVKRYMRYGTSVTLVLIDIDDFKLVNDTLGHPEGDRILRSMAQRLEHVARDADICCRYGGEEFAVILPITMVRDGQEIASRIRTQIGEVLPNGRSVTVSIGVAGTGEKTRTYQELVRKADAALYSAKKSGKNMVTVAKEGH